MGIEEIKMVYKYADSFTHQRYTQLTRIVFNLFKQSVNV